MEDLSEIFISNSDESGSELNTIFWEGCVVEGVLWVVMLVLLMGVVWGCVVGVVVRFSDWAIRGCFGSTVNSFFGLPRLFDVLVVVMLVVVGVVVCVCRVSGGVDVGVGIVVIDGDVIGVCVVGGVGQGGGL